MCLLPFGSSHYSIGDETGDVKYLGLDYEFSWCMNCKHGGHVRHIMEWFKEHDECCVSGCDCQCMKRDKIV